MRRWTIVLIAVLLSSCAPAQGGKRVGEIKSGMVCLEFKEGMNWDRVSQDLGRPDLTPPPEPGSELKDYTRIYQDFTLIFYTRRQPEKQGDKLRFEEVVYKLEVCKKR
jgi:hypothetical protein